MGLRNYYSEDYVKYHIFFKKGLIFIRSYHKFLHHDDSNINLTGQKTCKIYLGKFMTHLTNKI